MITHANQQLIGLGLLPVTDHRFSEAEYIGGDALAGLRDVQGHSGDGPRLNGGRAPANPIAPGNKDVPSGLGAGFLGSPTVDGLPLNKPPYGVISAINLDRGEIAWSVPHGDTPDAIRNHPALRGLNIPRTGQQGNVGTIVTKNLVIAGEPAITTANHPRGALLRAYDKRTGKDAGTVLMEARQTRRTDDLYVEGQAVCRRRDQRTERARSVRCVRAARRPAETRANSGRAVGHRVRFKFRGFAVSCPLLRDGCTGRRFAGGGRPTGRVHGDVQQRRRAYPVQPVRHLSPSGWLGWVDPAYV